MCCVRVKLYSASDSSLFKYDKIGKPLVANRYVFESFSNLNLTVTKSQRLAERLSVSLTKLVCCYSELKIL